MNDEHDVPPATDRPRASGADWEPAHPFLAIASGILLAVLGVGVLEGGGPELAGWLMALVGGVMIQIGVIAQGVFLGMEIHQRKRRPRA